MSIQKESYQLVVKISLLGIDPIEAREKAKKIIDDYKLGSFECKLQKLEDGKPPQGIKLPFLKK